MDLADVSTVFFEYLYLDGVRVAAHTDISDTNQIIYIPSIKTTLIDSENGSHSSAADQDITLLYRALQWR